MKDSNKEVYLDCAKNMQKSLIINILSESIDAIVVALVVTFLGEFTDSVIRRNVAQVNIGLIIGIILGLVFLILFIPIIDFLKNILMLKGALSHDRCLYSRYLQARYDKIREIEMGEVQYRLENDPIDLRFYWIEIITKCFVVFIVSTFLFIKCYGIDCFYILLVITISVLRTIIPMYMRKYEGQFDLNKRNYESDNKSLENEYITNISFVKRQNIMVKYIDALRKLFEDFFEQSKKKQIAYESFRDNINELTQKFSYIVILLIGCFFVENNRISLGIVVMMLGYSGLFDRICSDIDFVIRKTPILINSCKRIAFFYENREEVKGNKFLPNSVIRIKDLSFSYEENKIFKDYNANILMNKKNVLVGENGSGKTTLLKIVYGLEKVGKGNIYFDENDMKNIDLDYWRNHIGVAFQNAIVFEGSVKDNIIMFTTDSDYKLVDDIIKRLGLEKIANRKLVDNDMSISGGELQKISIARALAKKPYILFMDEPNNHLDYSADKWLYDFIKTYNGTLVYIAHSKKYIELADNIIDMV